MNSARTVDDTVAREIVHARRTEKVVGGGREGLRRPLALREQAFLLSHEISQAADTKLRSHDLPDPPDAEKIDLGPAPIEVGHPIALVVPPLGKGHSIHTIRRLFGLIDQFERSRRRAAPVLRTDSGLVGTAEVPSQGEPGQGRRLTAGDCHIPSNALPAPSVPDLIQSSAGGPPGLHLRGRKVRMGKYVRAAVEQFFATEHRFCELEPPFDELPFKIVPHVQVRGPRSNERPMPDEDAWVFHEESADVVELVSETAGVLRRRVEEKASVLDRSTRQDHNSTLDDELAAARRSHRGHRQTVVSALCRRQLGGRGVRHHMNPMSTGQFFERATRERRRRSDLIEPGHQLP